MARIYRTNFLLAENPISEGGNWMSGRMHGLDWADVLTTPGLARGSPSLAPFDDPTAILTGDWGPDQDAQAIVYSLNQTESYYQEVEIRLRSSMLAHTCTGYEVLFRCLKSSNAYLEIVRWEGPLAKFTYLSRNKGSQYGVANGDIVRATIIGNRISAYINDRLMDTVKDDTCLTGSPGIGFNYGCGETYGDFGFTSFTAMENKSAL
jgi:hypothetical protein